MHRGLFFLLFAAVPLLVEGASAQDARILTIAAGSDIFDAPRGSTAAPTAPPPGDVLRIPGLPPVQLPPGTRVFGPEGLRTIPLEPRSSQDIDEDGGRPRRAAPKTQPKPSAAERAEALKKALAPKPSPVVVRARVLDDLFKRLAASADAEEAKGIAGVIEHVWLRSDSDTANLLMQRALASMEAKQYPLALKLLDTIVVLDPDWAEAWNKRATTRYLGGDLDGAMADIDEVLKREPRHFGALAGMGAILQRVGLDKRALDVFRKALAVYPRQPDIESIVEKLTLKVEGRDI